MRKPQNHIQHFASQHHLTSRRGKGLRGFRLTWWEQAWSCFLCYVGQVTQVSEGQREFSIKNRLSGEQTGLGGAEPKGAGSPYSETLYASLVSAS